MFKIQGLGFRIQDFGFLVNFKVQGLRLRV